MEKMVSVQKRLMILAEEADVSQKQSRLYHECLCHIHMEGIPQLLRREYFHIVTLANLQLSDQILTEPETRLETNATLSAAILLLYTHLTEWLAIEAYLRRQRNYSSRWGA